MKINITIDLANFLKNTPIDEITDAEIEKLTNALPKQVVVLPKDEKGMEPHRGNSDPLKYTVQKGDTIKKVAQKFGVSYGELSMHILNKTGSTSIAEGEQIEIPRHFIDLSQA
jgi:LysM repeat protein